jgi:hypothetical protein
MEEERRFHLWRNGMVDTKQLLEGAARLSFIIGRRLQYSRYIMGPLEPHNSYSALVILTIGGGIFGR